MKTALLTTAAMLAFAANSVLARLALADGAIDAGSYTGIRLVSGAATLLLLMALSRGRAIDSLRSGSWIGAAALFGYAIGFSIAYLLLGAGVGALVLFATVQFSMLATALWKGERPGSLQACGLALALAGFLYLVSPGLSAPPPLGVVLMMVAGVCWAAYSLVGRASRTPLADTTGNFVRLVPFGLALLAAGLVWGRIDPRGVFYACLSGALASGVGYAIWYAALPKLTRVRAAIVQLTVPALAALGGVLALGEALDARLILASVGILGGVTLALVAADRRTIKAN